MTGRTIVGWIVGGVLVLSACSSAAPTGDPGAVESTVGAGNDQASVLVDERLDAIDEAVATWGIADTKEEADAAAEAAANLVVGPNGPGYGDRDGDGTINGANEVGLLPGVDGTPDGIAAPLSSNECVNADLLGGSWANPGERWDEMLTAIDEWRPDNNTMPSLESHPMRIIGWSTFTIATDSLDLAHEYAGHAKLHVDVSRDALEC